MPERDKYRESVGMEDQPDRQADVSPNGFHDTTEQSGRDTGKPVKTEMTQSSFSWNFPFVFLIRLYQRYLTHMLPPSCRFEPTCSHYALQAFQKYPVYKALYLSIRRILKCHPFHKGGYDPLP